MHPNAFAHSIQPHRRIVDALKSTRGAAAMVWELRGREEGLRSF